MTTHTLKTWPESFAEIENGTKRFELRVDDRPYAVGDTLELCEWVPSGEHTSAGLAKGDYTGRELRVRVTYLLRWEREGLGTLVPGETVLMSIALQVAPGEQRGSIYRQQTGNDEACDVCAAAVGPVVAIDTPEGQMFVRLCPDCAKRVGGIGEAIEEEPL